MFEEFTREELVAEYIETVMADYLVCPLSGKFESHAERFMPKDAPKDLAYWKSKDKCRLAMHKEIARRYGLDHDRIPWLSNFTPYDIGYFHHGKLKVLIRDYIKQLEKQAEEEKGGAA